MIPRKSNWSTDPLADLPTFLGFDLLKATLLGMHQKSTIQKINQVNPLLRGNTSSEMISPVRAIESREVTASPISIGEEKSPGKVPSLCFPSPTPSSNEVFIELQTSRTERKTHYIFANHRDTSKAQKLLSSKTGGVTQLYITHFWKDCASHEPSEQIVYEYKNLENPISIQSAILVLEKYRNNQL